MSYKNSNIELARKQLERRLSPLRKRDDLARPPRGWIRALRDALGMTSAQLAKRAGVSQPRVTRLEKAEVEGGVTLRTMREVAAAMDCTLIYAIVPNQPLDDLVRERARRIAEKQLARTHHTMKLENQALDARDLDAERQRLIAELLRGDPGRLWDDK